RKRRGKSLPGRVYSFTPRPSLRGVVRNPSCLILCTAGRQRVGCGGGGPRKRRRRERRRTGKDEVGINKERWPRLEGSLRGTPCASARSRAWARRLANLIDRCLTCNHPSADLCVVT